MGKGGEEGEKMRRREGEWRGGEGGGTEEGRGGR